MKLCMLCSIMIEIVTSCVRLTLAYYVLIMIETVMYELDYAVSDEVKSNGLETLGNSHVISNRGH